MNRTSVRQDRGQLVASVISAAIVVLVTVAGVTALWMVRDQLPDQIATHWGANGQADGFTAVEQIFVMNALLGGLLPLGVVLFVITIIVNVSARSIVGRFDRRMRGA